MTSRKYVAAYSVFGAVLFAMMLVFVAAPRPALACEPTPVQPGYIPPTPIPLETQVAGVIQDAQIVLDGTVKTWIPSSGGNSILTVQVEQYWKGRGPKTVRISGYFWDCPPNFALQQGSRYTFFVNGDPSSTEPLQVRDWFDSQQAVEASVQSSTGQGSTAPDEGYEIWVSVPVILVLGLIMLLRHRRARS